MISKISSRDRKLQRTAGGRCSMTLSIQRDRSHMIEFNLVLNPTLRTFYHPKKIELDNKFPERQVAK